MASSIINPRSLVQVLTLDKDALKFPTPFSMCISGPSQVKIRDFYFRFYNRFKDEKSSDYI